MTNNKKMTLVSLILMIFTSVFGFTNIPRSFYLMGYAAIPWYVISALLFFIPYAFMMAEYGAAFKSEKGGIYSWMKRSVGEEYAFIGTFMWYASYVIWMVNVSSSIWVPVSTAFCGEDATNKMHFFNLSTTQTMGILAVLLMLAITIISTKGLEKITKFTSLGGLAVTSLNLVLLFGSIIVIALNGGHFKQPISFVTSPNPNYLSGIAILSFMVFSIFAFGGIEVVGGLVDKTENAEKTFPKGVSTAAIVIAVGYALGIFLCGSFTNWNEVLASKNVNMANVTYIMMKNLGYQVGTVFNMSPEAAKTLGLWMARYTGASMSLALLGAFFTLSYAPLKQLIEGTPKEMWPEFLRREKGGMPVNAMVIQCTVVIIFALLISFGGKEASKFFDKLILMTNVAMTIPYVFIAGAFPAFKNNKEIEKPFEIYKTKTSANIATAFTVLLVCIANIATILSPYIEKNDLSSTLWMVAGPLLFTGVAVIIYKSYKAKVKSLVKE